ncbi:MAG: acyl-CoA dehydrogenase [Chloroflexi bacterium]|nr:MAG: acyl-CoA dehydrogenase [Chloroflexota bacterium]
MIDFSLTDDIGALEAELLRFASNQLRDRARGFEAGGGWDAATLKTFRAFGVAGVDAPESWGGVDLGALAKVVALEAISRGDAGGIVAADTAGPATAAALVCPDQTLAARVVTAALAGENRAALVLADQADEAWMPGSTAPAWTWTSHSGGLRLLDTAGCAATLADAGALHASGGVAVDLSGAETVAEWTLDPETVALLRGRARLWPAAVLLGVATASLDYGMAYARERVVMGIPVAHHQGNAFAIAEAAGMIEAARASVRAAAVRIDQAMSWAGVWATLAYLDAVDAALHATDLGVQLLGGHGYVEDHPAEKWFREARALTQLLGGRQSAIADAAEYVLDLPDPLLA